jgi:hypothetical protein
MSNQSEPVNTTALIQALSRMIDNRHSDRTSSIVSAEDRSTIINTCQALTLAARQSAQVQDVAVPEGWQLVPKEPTEEMIAEACSSAPHVIITYTKPEERDGTIPLIPLATWRAMLAAAPAKQEVAR